MVGKGQIQSLEALIALFVVLTMSMMSLASYDRFLKVDFASEEYKRIISTALFKLDEVGVLPKIASRGDWNDLLEILRSLLPGFEVHLTVYDEGLIAVYSSGCCRRLFFEVYYVHVLPFSGRFYALRVLVGEGGG